MAMSIFRLRRWRKPHRTITEEDEHEHGGGGRRRTIPEKDERGGRAGGARRKSRRSTVVSLEQSTLMDSDAPYLPQEIFTNILKRLPVKSLIRFHCVCKDWKNLFKTPSFIAEHVRHSTQQAPALIFQGKLNAEHLCLINRDMQVLKYEIASSFVRGCRIIGSSNGLLCLGSESISFIVWNPSTREVLEVPTVPNINHTGFCCVGFGFSPIVNDYKIVRLSLSSLEKDRVYLVQVFSVSTRSWKAVEVGKLKGIVPFSLGCGFTFDGAIFWFGCPFKPWGKKHCLISFDIATESFTLIPIPRSAHVNGVNRLTVYKNKLAMLSKIRFKWIQGTRSLCCKYPINLWVMEKCVDMAGERWIWTNIHTSSPCPDRVWNLRPLTICGNEIVGVTEGTTAEDTGDAILVSCNIDTNEFKMFTMGKCYNITVIWDYAESLVSVGGTFTLKLLRPKS